MGGTGVLNPVDAVDEVACLNQQAMDLTAGLIGFKSRLLNDVLACHIFTFNYPLLIEHILREANHYLRLLSMLESGMRA
jgi:hypothetical protein